MNKVIKYILIVVAIIATLIIGLNLYLYSNQKIEVSSFKGYYHELAKQCEQKSSFGCCIASVRAMENGNYRLSENNICDDSFTPNVMRCIDSFKWCEPVKK